MSRLEGLRAHAIAQIRERFARGDIDIEQLERSIADVYSASESALIVQYGLPPQPVVYTAPGVARRGWSGWELFGLALLAWCFCCLADAVRYVLIR